MSRGINFFGPYEARDSIGRVAALNIECLKASGMPVDIHLLSRPTPSESVNYATIDDHLLSSLKYKINLFHFNARRVPLYFSRLSEGSLNGFYNIGFWVHETQKIPDQWARQLEFFDEIWTPSSLCQFSVSRSANIPVLRVPYPIEKGALTLRVQARRVGQVFDCFNFLTIFDVYSDAERKNPLLTVRAFLEAYEGVSSVRLIVKVRNLEYDPLLSSKLKDIVNRHSNVEVIDGYLGESEIAALYERADVYVSLHRAEGFGLTISDAISKGIPVIATGYSGNVDFCDATNTRLVGYRLDTVGHNRPRYRHDDVWAEPDLHDAVLAFTEMYANYPGWIEKALLARERVEREFSVECVGALMHERINLIANNFSFPDDMSNREIDMDVGIVNTYGF
jgi:glycosyltransferase involved in cell wall biosynthesis